MKYRIIALIGESGSGKDTMMGKIIARHPDLHEIISYTTRPMREGEKDGVNYHYVNVEQFYRMVENYEMLEATVFNNWCYGTGVGSLREDAINIGVFNPDGIIALLSNRNIELEVFYVEVSDKTRLIRQLTREEHPNVDEIIRRFSTDRTDFYDLDFYYHTVPNETLEDMESGIKQIELWLEHLRG